MRVMQRAVIEYRDTKPLPSTVTDVAVRGATLPTKIEAARRAIAECVDLPELLRYQDQAQGLAAAVRVMKSVAPEMVANANRMCKEAILRMGQLLLEYSGEKESHGTKMQSGCRVPIPPTHSPRSLVAMAHGIHINVKTEAVRVASAPKSVIRKILESDDIPPNSRSMAQAAPRTRAPIKPGYGDAMRLIMRKSQGHGLVYACMGLRNIDLGAFAQLTPDERKVVKAKICEIMELLDEMDRLCK